MSALSELLSGPVGQAVGWALIHVTWQGLLVAIALAAALASSRDSRIRYGYCVAALALLILAPVITFAVSLEAATAAEAAVSVAADHAGTLSGDAPPGSWPVRAPTAVVAPTPPAAPAWLASLTGLWLAGVAAFATRVALQWLRARQLVRHDVRPAGADLERQLSALLSRLKLTRPVRVMLSTRVDVPLVVGWLSPVVLLPLGATDVLSPAQVRAVLAHELAHVKRLDGLVNLVQALVEALLFFHPAAWWVSARLRVEREFCCDDVAVAASGSALEYAKALATLDALRPDHPEGTGLVPATLSSHGGSLMDRIARLAGRTPARPPRRLLPGATLLLVSALSATGMALATPTGDDCLAERLDGVQLATGEDGCQLVFARSGDAWSVRCVDEDCAELVTVDVQASAGAGVVDALVADGDGELIRLALEGLGEDELDEDGFVTYEMVTDEGERNIVILNRRGGSAAPVMITRKPQASGNARPGVVGGYRVKLQDGHRDAIREEFHKARTKIRLDGPHDGHVDGKAEKVKAKLKLKAKGDVELEDAVQAALDQAAKHGAGAGVSMIKIVDGAGNTQVVEVHASDEPGHDGRDGHDGHDGDNLHKILRETFRGSDGRASILRIGPELIELNGDEGGLLELFRFDNEGRLLQHDRQGDEGGVVDLEDVLIHRRGGDEDSFVFSFDHDGDSSETVECEDGHFGVAFMPNELIEVEDVPHGVRKFFVSLDDEDDGDGIVTWLSAMDGDDDEWLEERVLDDELHIDDETGSWVELELDEIEAEDDTWLEIDGNVFFGDDEEVEDSANLWFTTAFGDEGGVWVTSSGDHDEDHNVWFSEGDEGDEGHGFWVTSSGDEHEVHDGPASVWLTDMGENVFFTDDDASCGGCGDSCESECGDEDEAQSMTWRQIFVGDDDEDEDEVTTWRQIFVGDDEEHTVRGRVLFGDDDEHEVHDSHDRFTVRGRVLDHEGHEVRDAQVRYKLRTDEHGEHDAPRAVQRFMLRGGLEIELPERSARTPRRVLRTDVAPRIMRWRDGHELPAAIRSRIGTRREAPQGPSWRVFRDHEDRAGEHREVEIHVELRGEEGAEVERRVLRLPTRSGEHQDDEGVMRWRYEVEPSSHELPASDAPDDEQPADEPVIVAGVVTT